MTDVDYKYIIKMVKQWALFNYNVEEDSVNVFSLNKMENGNWKALCSFRINNFEKRFLILLDSSGNVISYSDFRMYGNFHSSQDLTLVAEIFSIIAIIGYSIALIEILYIYTVYYSEHPYLSCVGVPVGPNAMISFTTILGFLLIPIIVSIIVGIYILSRILKIRRYLISGDIASAINENTVALGIIALIFNGIITGVLLLISRGYIKQDQPF